MHTLTIVLKDRHERMWRELIEATGLSDQKLTEYFLALGFRAFTHYSKGNGIKIADPNGDIIGEFRPPRGKFIKPFIPPK